MVWEGWALSEHPSSSVAAPLQYAPQRSIIIRTDVTVDLSSVLLSTAAQRRALQLQCITIPAGMTDLRAFEAQPYGSFLMSEELTFLRSTDGGIAEVKDSTFSFRGATVLTVVPADPAYCETQSRNLATYFFSIWSFAALAKAFAGNEFGLNPRGYGLNSDRAAPLGIL